MRCKGAELEADWYDPCQRERMGEGLRRLAAACGELGKVPGSQERAEGICLAALEFFEEAFGEGAARAVFGDRCGPLDCLEALAQLGIELGREGSRLRERRARYLPKEAFSAGEAG